MLPRFLTQSLAAVLFVSSAFSADESCTFRVAHNLKVKDLPADAKQVRVWFWLPDDDEGQKLLDLAVRNAPKGYRITRDAANGHRYLYAEFKGGAPVVLETDFTIVRHALGGPLDAEKATALTDTHRVEFIDYLRRDEPKMEVTPAIEKLAQEICGAETNVVKQARKIYDYVLANSDHYSLPNAPKSSNEGSVEYCLTQKGGGCTDQHALFIALARARGIPTKLQFGSRLQAKNEGKEVDAGYRCWVQYFVPGYGWVSTDCSAGDTTPDARDRYASYLDARRVRFLEGRNLTLAPPQAAGRVNLMIGAYIEVDGKPHTAFDRTIKFEEIKPAKS